MLRTSILFIVICAFFSLNAHADIQDRIDSCEQSGGTACIFSLLRELAGHSNEGNERPIVLKTGIYDSSSCRPYSGAFSSQDRIELIESTPDAVILTAASSRYVLKCAGSVCRSAANTVLKKSSRSSFTIHGTGEFDGFDGVCAFAARSN